MYKSILYCDRCGNVCEQPRINNGFNLFKSQKLIIKTSQDKKIDLCQKCYDSLAVWMSNADKENKE